MVTLLMQTATLVPSPPKVPKTVTFEQILLLPSPTCMLIPLARVLVLRSLWVTLLSCMPLLHLLTLLQRRT